jgi:N-acetyl sugar amidotransferase
MNSNNLKIEFDKSGRCNFCKTAEIRLVNEKNPASLTQILQDIRSKSKGKYDCIIGLSGGLDSSYLAFILRKEFGLNPLAIHLDNGWNSETAVSNIRKVVKSLEIDLVTHVIDWEEFRDLQRAFFRSGLKNCEIPTDHAILAFLYQQAGKNNVKYILHGGNNASESIMPNEWMEDSRDFRLIKGIAKKFSNIGFESYPHLPLRKLMQAILIRRIKYVGILNYLVYNKVDALMILEKEIGYKKIEVKHGESTFTKFFQEIFLPNRFGIDKRLAHFSSEVVSGNMSREEALDYLAIKEVDSQEKSIEISFVLDKLEFSEAEWLEIMTSPKKRLEDYAHTPFLHDRRTGLIQMLRKFGTAR